MALRSRRSGIHHRYQPSTRTLGELQFNQIAVMQQQQQFQEALDNMWSPPVTPYNRSFSTAGTDGFAGQQHYAQAGSFQSGEHELANEVDSSDAAQETVDDCNPTGNVEHIDNSKSSEHIRQLEKTIHALKLQRDKHEKDSIRAKGQLENARRECGHLERQVYDLRLQLSEGNPNLKRQIATLEEQKRELMDTNEKKYYEGQMSWMCTQNAQNEWVVLFQQVEKYKEEAAKWKQEALGKGVEALDIAWQASVDEAVERKREQDNLGWKLAIKMLQEENAALRAEKRK